MPGSKTPWVVGGVVCFAVLVSVCVAAVAFVVTSDSAPPAADANRDGVPDRVVAGTTADGKDLYACVASYKNNLTPGKVWDGKCSIPFDGKEVAVGAYEVFKPTRNYVWGPAAANPIRAGSNDKGEQYFLCRADPGTGVKHPGKSWNGANVCLVPYAKQEIAKKEYDVANYV